MDHNEKNTIADSFIYYTNYYKDKIFIAWKEEGVQKKLTYSQTSTEVLKCCIALKNYGLEYGQHVVYWGPLAAQALILDFACQFLGCVFVGISPSMSAKVALDLIKKTNAKILMVSPEKIEQLKVAEFHNIPLIKICINTSTADVILWKSFLDVPYEGQKLESFRSSKLSPETQSSIFFTSGTSGFPKGVIHTNKSILSIRTNSYNRLSKHFVANSKTFEERSLFMDLPFSVLHNGFLNFIMMCGLTMVIDKTELVAFKSNPHHFFLPGGELSNLQKEIIKGIDKSNFILKNILKFSISHLKKERLKILNKHQYKKPKLNLFAKIIDLIFIRPIRKKFGQNLADIHIGASNQDAHAVEFFFALGIPIWNLYGSTECALISCNCENGICVDSVGKPVDNMDFKIDEETKSLWIKGDSLFSGYLGEPPRNNEEWYNTQDVAEIDENGFLHILGRANNRIKLKHGAVLNVEHVETHMLRSEYIEQICLFGDKQEYLIALIKPSTKLDTNIQDPKTFLLSEIHQLHAEHGLQEYELIKDLIIIPDGFNRGNGLMTETRKLIRKNIYQTYQSEINKLYND